MDLMTQDTLFIERLFSRLDEIRRLLGSGWPAFQEQLLDLLGASRNAPDRDTHAIVDRIIELGLNSPAAEPFRTSLMEATAMAGLIPTKGVRKYFAYIGPLSGPGRLGREALDRQIARLAMELVGHLEQAAISKDLSSSQAGSSSRFLNAGFFRADSDVPLPTDQPLALDGGPYRLGVNVGQFWGPGTPGEATLDELLKHAFEMEPELELHVAIRSRSVQADPAWQPLPVPRTGDSAPVFFQLTFGYKGRHSLHVDLFYHGHLLQSRRLEVEVVKEAGQAAPAGHPAQDGRPIFCRATALAKDTLVTLEERPSRLTITVDRDEGLINLHFYDWAHREKLGAQTSRLTDDNLGTLLDKMRRTLQAVTDHYGERIGGDLDEFRVNLWQLADVGSDFYRALLPTLYDPMAAGPGGQPVDLELVPGQVIQVAPLSPQAGVPWELLYERPIENYRKDRPDRVALCPEWLTHEPGACPHQGDPRVVCPSGFWGYRYIIEQLPNRVQPGQPPLQTELPLLVRNGLPLHLVALVYGFKNLEAHLRELVALVQPQTGSIDLERIETLEDVEQALTDTEHPADILYFYAHGGFDQDEPTLTLGPRNQAFPFTVDDLVAWPNVDLTLRQPLVVLNACESAAYRPDQIESLLEAFTYKGAAGVIGTQCKVPTTLADVFIRSFFHSFLGRATVGQALFDARLALLRHTQESPGGPVLRPDPRGLIYSLFAAADVKLAQPLLT